MKYVKSIDLATQSEGRYQRGQTAKDKFNNLHVFQGIGKDGLNVWLQTTTFNSIEGRHKARFHQLTGVPTKGFKLELRAARRQLRRIVKLESSFGRGKFGFQKDVRQQYYLENTKGV